MGAAVCKNEGAGPPGVGCAHVQRVGRLGADLPVRVQVVKFVVLADDCFGMGIMVAEASVDVAVVDDGPGRRSRRGRRRGARGTGMGLKGCRAGRGLRRCRRGSALQTVFLFLYHCCVNLRYATTQQFVNAEL